MMHSHYTLLLEKFDLPPQALAVLTAAGQRLLQANAPAFERLVAKFYRTGFRVALIEVDLQALAQASGVPYYTLCFVFVAAASVYMLADYQRAGLCADLFWETIFDLRCKLFECHEVKQCWGTFVLSWYPIFFSLNLYKLGRLEFERTIYPEQAPYICGDLQVNTGDTVYSIHIPSCGSLKKELRMESYRRAYDFFADERQGKPLICICHSWLLYPQNKVIFPPQLNTVDFMGDWDIIKSEESPEFEDAWRVFGMDFDPKRVPQETTQQKSLYNWIINGNKTGAGLGVFIFNGTEIVNK